MEEKIIEFLTEFSLDQDMKKVVDKLMKLFEGEVIIKYNQFTNKMINDLSDFVDHFENEEEKNK